MTVPSATRLLSWPGCENARDLGGLPTAQGGAIRAGALLRSDRLATTGVRAVLGHGVSLVLDLRLAAECQADPSPLAGHPIYRNLSVLRCEDTVLEAMADTLPGIYRAILDRGRARLAAVLSAVARAPRGGVLLHCHSGKDRTGLAVALALTVAGVPEADITADYALTATCLRLDEAAGERSRALFAEITAATMLGALSHLRDTYGGAEPYLTGGGMEPADLIALKARLT